MIKFFKNIFKPATDFSKLLQECAVIIDVRSVGEYQSGHIDGSKNIPLDRINKEIPKIKNFKKPIITVCQSGARSRMARSILTAAGIETYNGGGWLSLKRKI
ncbi:MAG TPA: rhodanese-like domain-containing protein [Chitinophagaceae bacterium]